MSREKLQNNLGHELGPAGSRRGLHMVFGARGGGWAGAGGGGRGEREGVVEGGWWAGKPRPQDGINYYRLQSG